MASPSSPWRRPASLLLLSLCCASAALASGSAADYFVRNLPGLPADSLVKMHAGQIEVDHDHNGNLFFWHFQNQHVADRQRTVIWLNGGPGCSSEDGALMEIGPFRLRDDHSLVPNNGSWNEFANLLFVDNPTGTGYSYVDTNSFLTELDVMSTQFVTFLEKWFAVFPDYEQDDLYIAGESYAGQHIPHIARRILERNARPGVTKKWPLKGLLIGNGWISPSDQYEAYFTFAYEHGLIDKNSDIAQHMQQQWQICKGKIDPANLRVEYAECESMLSDMLRLTSSPAGPTTQCFNMYDVRLNDSWPSCGMNWPPDLAFVTPYLQRKDVVKALNVGDGRDPGWTECNGRVGMFFRSRTSKPSVQLLPDILAAGVRLLLFSGDQDWICNHIGTETLISNLEWNGGRGFELAPGNWAPRRDWTFEGEPAGFWQEARNLTYVLFRNSSHMVPFDHARRTRDMLDRFMGVDISSIGGLPTDSRLDGEKGPPTSVGEGSGPSGGLNSGQEPKDDPAELEKLKQTKWQAYRRSGEVVLVIVAIAAVAWGYYVWRERRRASHAGYKGLGPGTVAASAVTTAAQVGRRARLAAGRGFDRIRGYSGRGTRRDPEAADYDEGLLEELHVASPRDVDGPRYSIGEESEYNDEADAGEPPPLQSRLATRNDVLK